MAVAAWHPETTAQAVRLAAALLTAVVTVLLDDAQDVDEEVNVTPAFGQPNGPCCSGCVAAREYSLVALCEAVSSAQLC